MTGNRPPADANPDGGLVATVMDRLGDAVLAVDTTGTIVFANPAASELFALPLDQLVGGHYRRFVLPEMRHQHDEWHAEFMATTESRPMGPGPCVRALRADGRTIDIEVSLSPIDDHTAALVARRASTTRRMVDRLIATNHLLTTALSGATDDELADQALNLVVETMQADRGGLIRVDAHGEHRLSVSPDTADNAPFADRLTQSDSPPPAGHHELIVGVPERGGVRSVGVWRDTDDIAFDDLDAELLHTLGFAVAVSFELVDERVAGERRRTMIDRDRIARELHDRAIQHLFAVAMRLEAAVPEAGGQAAGRMNEAVAELDEVIREIRTSIFDLRRPTIAVSGLRSAIAHEVDRVSATLGFNPRVHFTGVLDAVASPALTETASAVVRELLSNCARHADASEITVDVANADSRLDIVVADNGRGYDPDPGSTGDGLVNVAERARALGGHLDVARGDGDRGTVVTWSVPLAGPPQ